MTAQTINLIKCLELEKADIEDLIRELGQRKMDIDNEIFNIKHEGK